MYKKVKYCVSQIGQQERVEGETIEMKMERILDNKEPITDGAPEIYTERKDGVIAAYNIKTDRFEIACDAMDKVAGSIAASRENKGALKDKDKDGPENDFKADLKVVDGKEGEGVA